MATDIEMADESNSAAELDVVGDSRLVQPTNAYGSPLPGASSPRNEMPEEATASNVAVLNRVCLLYTSPSPRDQRGSRMPSSA